MDNQLYPRGFGYVYIGLIISGYLAPFSSSVRDAYEFARMSLATGRPIVLRDEDSLRHCRVLLSHRMVSPTDVRLVGQVELIVQKSTSSRSPTLFR